ncbi:UxaA family hydrolase [Bradyrhizobium sp. USDA 3315]
MRLVPNDGGGRANAKPEQSDSRLLLLSSADNVLVARGKVAAGETIVVDGAAVTLAITISLGHKIARCDIGLGERIVKCGVPIGSATAHIARGEHVHVHNVKSDYTPTHALTETSGATR